MSEVAQTNVQLYNQLRAQNRSDDELRIVHNAYEYSSRLYSGWYEGDGRPYVVHKVGTASVLAIGKVRAELVAAGLLHNIYGNGDFGDEHEGPTKARRRAVRKVVGDEIEGLIYGFSQQRITPANVLEMKVRINEMSAYERELLLMDVANRTEKHVDCAIHYYGDGEYLEDLSTELDAHIAEFARIMDHPEMAELLERLGAETEAAQVPALLRRSGGQRTIALSVPASCAVRWRLQAWRTLKSWRRRIVTRETLRNLKGRLISVRT